MTATGAAVEGRRTTRSERQERTVAGLLDAALDLVRERGYGELTIRAVATRAGVTHTTAYSYFTSKAHVVAEVFWQQLRALPPPVVARRTGFEERVAAAFADPARLMAEQPALAAASTTALLAPEPEVARIRAAIGAALAERLRAALGDRADDDVVEALLLAFAGAMTFAGTGLYGFDGVVERLRTVARLLDRRSRR